MKVLFHFVLTLLSMILYIICVLMLMKVGDNMFGNYFYPLYSLGKNWEKGPISKIYVTKDVCKSNDEFLIKDVWQGSSYLCKNSYLTSNCNIKRIKKYGSIVPEKEYNIWRGSLLCASRIKGNYLNYVIDAKQCSEDMKSCGYLDSFKNILCIKKDQDCPLNKIKMIPFTSPDPSASESSKINLKDAKMILSNETIPPSILEPVLNEFIIDEGFPCVNRFYRNYLEDPYLSEISYQRNKGRCYNSDIGVSLQDNTVSSIDRYSYYQVYNENGIISLMTNKTNTAINYNAYPDIDQHFNKINNTQRNLTLYQKGYIPISSSCISYMKTNNLMETVVNDLIDYKDYIDRQRNNFYGIFISELTCLIFYFCWASGFIFKRDGPKTNLLTEKAKSMLNIKISVYGTSLISIVNFVLFIIVWVIYLNMGSNSFNFLFDQKCFELSYHNYLFDLLKTRLSLIKSGLLSFLIPSILAVISQIFMLLNAHRS